MTEIHTLVGAYALDAVDDLERAAFDRHLAGCAACAVEVTELRGAAARLAEPTWSVPPPGLRAEVLAQMRRTRQVRPGPPGRKRGSTAARWQRRTAAAVVVGILVTGAGAATWALQEQRVRHERTATATARAEAERVREVLAAPDALVRSAAGPAGGGRVTVVVSVGRDEGVVLLDGLAEPAADRAYQLWLIGEAVTSAAVLPAGDGTATVRISGVRGKGVFGMTEEPAGGSAQPTTLPPLVTVPLT